MYSLIIDTTSKYLVVGLADSKIIDQIKYEAWQRQSEFAVKEIENILKRNNISVDEVDSIIVSKGPGSYTGVRIGLTIAKVFSIAKKIKVYAVSSLASMCNFNKKSIAILDARSNRFYVGVYYQGINEIDDVIMEKQELLDFIDTHKNYELVGDIDLLDMQLTEIDYVSNMFNLKNESNNVTDIDRLVPIYLKEVY